MLSLLFPGALLGLLALAVPAVLHLRRPPPPTVRVGSLRHLAATPTRRRQPWRWQERARLALRLALLAALVLALTGPVWRRPEDDRTPRRWSLVDPAAGTLTGPARERLEARRRAGDEVRLLSGDFPVWRPARLPPPLPGAVARPPEDLWSRLRELDARLPAGSSLTVFSPARLAAFHGERPTLGNVTVDWVETPSPRPRSERLEGLETLPDLRVVATVSAGDGDGLRRARGVLNVPAGPGRWLVPAPLTGVPALAVTRATDGIVTGELPGADGDAEVVPEASPRPVAPRVLIFHAAGREGDARRLASAIRLAAPAGGARPEAVVLVNPGRGALPPPDPAAPPDWVFCLGGPRAEELAGAAGVAGRARNLFTDAGEVVPADADPPPGILVVPEWAGGPDVRLRQGVALPVDGLTAVRWTDGAGVPLLTVRQPLSPAEPRRWSFGGRFDPAWNDLADTAALAGVLRGWFFPATADLATADPRLAGAGQARPAAGVPAPSPRSIRWPWPGADAPAARELRPWALALAAAGFLLERLWAYRRRPSPPAPATR